MKYFISKIILLIVGLQVSQSSFAQLCQPPTAEAILHGNSIQAITKNNGGNFSNTLHTAPHFYSPYDSTQSNQTSTLFTSALWVGAYDPGNNLLTAIQQYNQNGHDFYAGPIDANIGTTDSSTCAQFDNVWKIDRATIEAHIQDYNDDGQIQNLAVSLREWPGRGNPHFSTIMGYALPDKDLAPFYDHNNDLIYDPNDGDYPVFKHNDPTAIASDMTWTVFNDIGNVHSESSGLPLKIEVQQTAYALSCTANSILNRTVFVKHKIINYNTITLNRAKVAYFVDFDLGNGTDDLIAVDSGLNCMYAYNGDAVDDGPLGYGTKPPVQSALLLNQSLARTFSYTNSNSPINGNPNTAIHYYRYMDGQFLDGSNQPANFLYSAAPTDTTTGADHMFAQGITSNDFKSIMTVDIGDLTPGAIHKFDIAYVYHRDTSLADHIEMTNLVYSELPQVQNWYDSGYPSSCFPSQLLTLQQAQQQNTIAHRLYPNPNTGQFQLELATINNYQFKLTDVAGHLVYQTSLNGQNQYSISTDDLPNGLYFYQLSDQTGQIQAGKIQIQH